MTDVPGTISLEEAKRRRQRAEQPKASMPPDRLDDVVDDLGLDQHVGDGRESGAGGKVESLPTTNLRQVAPPRFSDDDLALLFTEKHQDELRYVAAWGKWLRWDGKVWRPDTTLGVYDLARVLCREVAADCNTKAKRGIASANKVAAVERLAKSDRRHATDADAWDRDPWLATTPAGTIDLKSGQLRLPDPSDYITKMMAVAPDGDCPRWRIFLARVTASDPELQAFLQRMAGYALTGTTSEHALFFFYGTGANGKSVFINTLAGILADYHRTAPMDTFLVSHTDRHPTELAGLRGARLVTAVETQEGRRWDEAKIKTLTGGDEIAARFMRQDFFEFTPVFKLMIAGNHKPSLVNVDEAIRRRIHLVPFTVTIPEDERDKKLLEKLKAEWPGILRWAIEGCQEWQRIGLAPPRAVRDATTEYLTAEDAVGQWIDELCIPNPTLSATTSSLFGSFTDWCKAAGERHCRKQAFGDSLEERGFKRCRIGKQGARGHDGIALRDLLHGDDT